MNPATRRACGTPAAGELPSAFGPVPACRRHLDETTPDETTPDETNPDTPS